MMDSLPQWMQDVWPYMVWGGGAAIIVNEIVFRNLKRYRGFRDHDKHANDS